MTAANVRARWLAAPAGAESDALALAALDALDDRDVWRAVALAALERLHGQHGESERLRHRLRERHDDRRRRPEAA